jgi:hypothetical protein
MFKAFAALSQPGIWDEGIELKLDINKRSKLQFVKPMRCQVICF